MFCGSVESCMQCFVVLFEGVCSACGSVGSCMQCFVVLFEGVCSALWFC